MSETFTNYPGEKVYGAADGHERVVTPTFSQFDGKWFYIYALSSHSDGCHCASWDVDDFGELDGMPSDD